MDTTQRIEDLIFLIDELSQVLEEENSAILGGDHDAMDRLFEKKDRLSHAYDSRMKGLGEVMEENPIPAEELPADLLGKLGEGGAVLSTRIVENATLLEASIQANRQVLDLIAEAVKVSAPGPGTYSGKGNIPTGGHPTSPTSVPLSLDEVL